MKKYGVMTENQTFNSQVLVVLKSILEISNPRITQTNNSDLEFETDLADIIELVEEIPGVNSVFEILPTI